MLTRILTALPLIAGFVAALLWAPAELWLGLMALIVFLGAREWAALARLSGMAALAYALGLTLAGLALHLMNIHAPWAYLLSLAFWLLAPGLLWRGVPLAGPGPLLPLGLVVLIPTFLAFVELRQSAPGLLLALVALVAIADSGAYFSGRRFGKHKLAPAISPGKTWEGVAGAALAVMFYVLLLVWQFPTYLPVGLPLLLPMALFLLAVSIVGDLLESWIKRQAGVKDSGTLLPGHGGVLDRIDSLTAALPAAALFYAWMS
ncbi:MAG: phosphatidate cytidylyltransferase [Pseudomonadota bacterium]